MAKRKPTIHEVAHLAKVGIGTVSRVLNNHPSVRAQTRARVLAAMSSLGYSPNPHARRVAGGRSYTVSLILPVISTEFYNRLLEGIEQVLSEERYEIALFPIFSPQRLQRYLESRSLAYQTDGLLVASQGLAHLLPDQKFPTERPVVLVDAYSPRYDSAYVDNRLGGRMAAQHLAQFPGELFAIQMQEELDEVMRHTVGQERVAGFREGLEQAGRELPDTHVFVSRFSAEGGRLALQHFMRQSDPPTTSLRGPTCWLWGCSRRPNDRASNPVCRCACWALMVIRGPKQKAFPPSRSPSRPWVLRRPACCWIASGATRAAPGPDALNPP